MKRANFYGFCSGLGKRVYMASWGEHDTFPVVVRLIAARLSCRLSQSEMARLLGVNKSTVFRWEHGIIESMSLYMVGRWAEITATPLSWLIDGGAVPYLDRYTGHMFRAVAALNGSLRPLPDGLGLVSNWKQYKDRERRRAEIAKEDAEDRYCDELAARRVGI